MQPDIEEGPGVGVGLVGGGAGHAGFGGSDLNNLRGGTYYGNFRKPDMPGSSARQNITSPEVALGGGLIIIEAEDFIHIDGKWHWTIMPILVKMDSFCNITRISNHCYKVLSTSL